MSISHTPRSRAVEPDGAPDDVAEPLALRHPPRKRVDDRPPAHPLAVELELRAQLVEAPAHPADGVRCGGELETAVAQERGDVERALADERLGVDRQAGLALGAQDVTAVEVLVDDDLLAVRRREQLADPRERAVEQRALEGPAVALPARRQVIRPAARLDGKRPEFVALRRRAPERAQHARGGTVGL